MTLLGGERDADGRAVIRLGGKCPACGAEPEMKYSSDGRVVLYHLPGACARHARAKAYDGPKRTPYRDDDE